MAGPSDLFSLLSARYGIGTALSLMSLFGGEGNAASKGFGAGQAASGGLTGLSSLTGNPLLGQIGSTLGTLGGLAGLGYGASQLAGAGPTPEKGVAAGQLGVQALPAIEGGITGGWSGLASGLKTGGLGALGGWGGQQLGGLAFGKSRESGLGGGAGAGTGALVGTLLFPGIGTLLGGLLGGFGGEGLGSLFAPKPTTGTLFRGELGNVFSQIPALKGTDTSKYQAPNPTNPLDYSMYQPGAVTAGKQLGQLLSAYAPTGKKSPDNYALQAENILLNKFGNTLPDILSQVLPRLQPQGGTMASAPTAPSSAGYLGPYYPQQVAQKQVS